METIMRLVLLLRLWFVTRENGRQPVSARANGNNKQFSFHMFRRRYLSLSLSSRVGLFLFPSLFM